MSTSDHYQLLGVERDADRRTIRAAYRKALRRHHPDANAGSREGEKVLLQVITAGRVLCNPKSRARYDQQFEKRSQQYLNKKTTIKKPPQRATYQGLLLGWIKIFEAGKQAYSIFFSAEQAQATETRAAEQRKRSPPGFNFYLHLATNRNSLHQYQRGEDGIYRRPSHQSRQTKLRNWRKRTAVWLLIGIMLWRG